MSNIAIKVEHLTKEYQIGLSKSGDLRESFSNKLGSLFNSKQNTETFTALDDVNFEVKKGEAVGIIGRNGAGKSTLLKILSRITEPTKGRFEINGRVSSLLEVGTGFHPELSGRENIYLNGTILGMKRAEIKAKFDEILDFSGVEKFIDTSVKHYSSGMKVRLAFSVAAHLEPEILIIDEVLAVGDAEFQKKCLGKMDDASKNEGRTVIFVSHNMGAIQTLCKKGILLNNGILKFNGSIQEVIANYLLGINNLGSSNSWYNINKESLKTCKSNVLDITSIKLKNLSTPQLPIRSGDALKIIVSFDAKEDIPSAAFVVKFFHKSGSEIIRLSNMPISGYTLKNLTSKDTIELTIFQLPLVKGMYLIDIGFVHEKVNWYFNGESIIQLIVEGQDIYKSGFILDDTKGVFLVEHQWNDYKLSTKTNGR